MTMQTKVDQEFMFEVRDLKVEIWWDGPEKDVVDFHLDMRLDIAGSEIEGLQALSTHLGQSIHDACNDFIKEHGLARE